MTGEYREKRLFRGGATERQIEFEVETGEEIRTVIDETFFFEAGEAITYGKEECEGVRFVAGDLFEYVWLKVREGVRRNGTEVAMK